MRSYRKFIWNDSICSNGNNNLSFERFERKPQKVFNESEGYEKLKYTKLLGKLKGRKHNVAIKELLQMCNSFCDGLKGNGSSHHKFRTPYGDLIVIPRHGSKANWKYVDDVYQVLVKLERGEISSPLNFKLLILLAKFGFKVKKYTKYVSNTKQVQGSLEFE